MGVLGKANIGGVLRNLTGEGYVNIGGVLRPITIGNFNIGGVLLAGGYTWKKYNTVENVTYEEKTESGLLFTIGYTGTTTLYSTKSFNTETGEFTLSGSKSVNASGISANYKSYPYRKIDTGVMEIIRLVTSSGGAFKYEYTLHYSEKVISYSQGTYIEDVTSPDASAYPENGRHTDGYWYVKQ